jgi:hypothetical protein
MGALMRGIEVDSPTLGRGGLVGTSFLGGGTGVGSVMGIVEVPAMKGPRLMPDGVDRRAL